MITRTDDFDRVLDHAALATHPMGGQPCLLDSDGRTTPLHVRRWHGPLEPAAAHLVNRCAGPTVDVGCGPGRLTGALAGRGVAALGIDTSAVAVRLTRDRGAPALRRDVFAALPDEGRWGHVLLMDGNIGIGGDPAALLLRCARLLRPGGTVLAEVDPPGTGLWRGRVRLAATADGTTTGWGTPFDWARLDADVVHQLAGAAGLAVRSLLHRDDRWFVELVRPAPAGSS